MTAEELFDKLTKIEDIIRRLINGNENGENGWVSDEFYERWCGRWNEIQFILINQFKSDVCRQQREDCAFGMSPNIAKLILNTREPE